MMRISKENKKAQYELYFTAKNEWGFKPQTASALRYLLQFCQGYKIPKPIEEKWKKANIITKEGKVRLDDEAVNGNGVAWIMIGLCYEGLLKQVQAK